MLCNGGWPALCGSAREADMSEDNNGITYGSASIRADLPSLWDDTAFKIRVRTAAEKRGMRLREALVAAGVSPGYLDKSGEGRSTAVVLRLAQILDVSPVYLMGLKDEKDVQPPDGVPVFTCSAGREAEEKLVKLSVYTKIISTQLATLSTLAYIASNGAGAEAKVLADLLKSLSDQIASSVSTADSDGKSI